MRVHQNQVNPNAHLDAMYSAQKAAGKKEAARTRKKLFEFASEQAGEASAEDGYAVKARDRDGDSDDRRGNDHRRGKAGEDDEHSISDWA